MVPVKLLFSRNKTCSDVRSPRFVGRFPVRPELSISSFTSFFELIFFGKGPSIKVLLDALIIVRSSKRKRPGGKLPLKEFSYTINVFRPLTFESSLGIVPVKSLSATQKLSNFNNLPTSVGIVPENLFLLTRWSTTVSAELTNSLSGKMSPESMFSSTSNFPSSRLNISSGTKPLSSLEKRSMFDNVDIEASSWGSSPTKLFSSSLTPRTFLFVLHSIPYQSQTFSFCSTHIELSFQSSPDVL